MSGSAPGTTITRTAPAGTRPTAVGWVELAVWGCSVGLVLSVERVFRSGGDVVPRLLLIATVAHLVPAGLRRVGMGPRTVVPLSLALGTIVIGAVYLPATTLAGLPTAETAVTAGRAMRAAFGPFRDLVAPVPARTGFQLALAGALWIVATFADAAAVWARATVQAMVPHTALFLFAAVLARGEDAVAATLAFATALVLLVLASHARSTAGVRWAEREAEPGRRAQARAGLGVAAVALVLLAVGAPWAPGVSTDGVVDLRRLGRGDGPRQVDNPLVGVSSLLGVRTDEVMFTVSGSPGPHYWRLTALETFDGDTWTSSATYRDVDDGERLPTEVPGGADASQERHRFEVTGLVSDWLPAASVPRSVAADFDVRFHAPSASLFLADADRARTGRTYVVESATGGVEVGDLAGPGSATPPDAALVQVPEATRRTLALPAVTVTAGARSPAEQALALERWFRDEANGFTYDTAVDYSRAPDPLVAFLEARVGFCQQYAGTFAAMARTLGLPARVAVGFTWGEPGTEPGSWSVRGRHAHAWPEVFVAGVGWLAFEPTPGRGNPDAESYTGRPPTQAAPTGGTEAVTTTTAPTTVAPPSTATPTLPDRAERPGAAVPTATAERSTAAAVSIGLVAVLAAGALLVGGRWAWVRRRRARRSDAPPAARVAAAWTAAWQAAARAGIDRDPAETPTEAGRRLARRLGSDAPRRLAELESDRRYAPDPPSDEAASQAETASDEIRELVAAGLGRSDRARMELEL